MWAPKHCSILFSSALQQPDRFLPCNIVYCWVIIIPVCGFSEKDINFVYQELILKTEPRIYINSDNFNFASLLINLQLYLCSKTSQTPTLSKRGLLKTPVGTTPNQRRKTWCFTEPNNKSTAVRTPCRRRSGILKHGNLTEKQTKRSCSFILRNKVDLTKRIAGLTSSDSFTSHTSDGIILAVEEEKVLIQSLEKCYEMFEEVII